MTNQIVVVVGRRGARETVTHIYSEKDEEGSQESLGR